MTDPELPNLAVPSRLWTQCPSSEAQAIMQFARDSGMGAIYTADPRSGPAKAQADLLANVQQHRETARGAGAAVDLNRYAGNGRDPVSRPLSSDWIRDQLHAGASFALTDSGFLDADDFDGLDDLLARAEQLPYVDSGRATLLLSLPSSWYLGVPKNRERLTRALAGYGKPVALALEHASDPLGAQKNVRGLLALLQGAGNVRLMRADYSAIGAVAAGAAWAAIGTKSGLRHVYPRSSGGGAPVGDAISVIWPTALAFFRAETLAPAIASNRNDPAWRCDCAFCGGRSIERIQTHFRAAQHSLYVAMTIERRLFSSNSSNHSLESWAQMCQVAQTVILEFRSTSHIELKVPDYLGAWYSAVMQMSSSG